MVYTVYKTTNLINLRFYIGIHSTNNPNDGYLGSGVAFKQALKKYGKDNFKKEVLFIYHTLKESEDKEREIVNEEFVDSDITYNLMVGGGSSGSPTKETRKKMSLAATGRKHTEEAREKISEAGRNRGPISDESRQKMRDANSGENNPNFGRFGIDSSFGGHHHTEETKREMSRKQKEAGGYGPEHHSDETKKKISDACTGYVVDTVMCPHCKKVGAGRVMKRWHFDNCESIKPKDKLECPHCGKVGGESGMKRWHFKNCKRIIDGSN